MNDMLFLHFYAKLPKWSQKQFANEIICKKRKDEMPIEMDKAGAENIKDISKLCRML